MSNIVDRLIESRIIYLNAKIDHNLATSVVSQLLFHDSESNEPIHMYISSPGGEIPQGLAIIDTMSIIKSKIYTYVLGEAASMAAIILISGDRRFASPNSAVMFHNPAFGLNGYYDIIDLRNLTDELNKSYVKLNNIIKKQTLLDPEDFKYKDLYIREKDLLKLHIVDEIINKCNSSNINKEKSNG